VDSPSPLGDTRLAMSQESLESWLRRSVDAWSRGDREAWLREVPPEWEFHTSGVFPGLKSVYRGVEEAVELWDAMRGPFERFTVTLERVEDLGDRLVGLVTFKVQGRDGIETGPQWAHVVTSRDGIPTRTDNFATWNDALAAVGLSE
jgi:ketosteroid isomerase-like protein